MVCGFWMEKEMAATKCKMAEEKSAKRERAVGEGPARKKVKAAAQQPKVLILLMHGRPPNA